LQNGVANYGNSSTDELNPVYFGPQTAKNRTRVLTHPPAIVQTTGVNNSVVFARWQQRAPIKLGTCTHSVGGSKSETAVDDVRMRHC